MSGRNCLHCEKWIPGADRSDKRFCSTRCRVAWNRYQEKIAQSPVTVPTHDQLRAAHVTISPQVFNRDMSVLEAIEKGHIIIRYEGGEG